MNNLLLIRSHSLCYPLRPARFLQVLMGTSICFALAGCGGNLPATVTGTVKSDGQLLDKGDLGFYPTSGGPPAMSTIEADGTFELSTGRQRGLKLGEYKVAVTSYNAPLKPGMTPKQVNAISNVHEKYRSRDTTDVVVEVVAGRNDFDIEVKRPE